MPEDVAERDETAWYEVKMGPIRTFASSVKAWLDNDDGAIVKDDVEAPITKQTVKAKLLWAKGEKDVDNESITTRSSRSSNSSSRSSSARLRAEAEKASLMAKYAVLQEKHALEDQEEKLDKQNHELRKKKEALELHTEVMANTAKLEVLKTAEDQLFENTVDEYIPIQPQSVRPVEMTPINPIANFIEPLTQTNSLIFLSELSHLHSADTGDGAPGLQHQPNAAVDAGEEAADLQH